MFFAFSPPLSCSVVHYVVATSMYLYLCFVTTTVLVSCSCTCYLSESQKARDFGIRGCLFIGLYPTGSKQASAQLPAHQVLLSWNRMTVTYACNKMDHGSHTTPTQPKKHPSRHRLGSNFDQHEPDGFKAESSHWHRSRRQAPDNAML